MEAEQRLIMMLSQAAHTPSLDVLSAAVAAIEDPGVRLEHVVTEIDALADGFTLPAGADMFESLARLNLHLFDGLGFDGDRDTYEDPQNSLIHRVVARRKGIPISLSVLYIEVARRVGLEVAPIGFPGHFLVRPVGASGFEDFYIDCFRQGTVLRREHLLRRLRVLGVPGPPEQFLSPVGMRDVVIRMTHNLKGAYLRLGKYADALRQVERLLWLQSDFSELHRTRGLLLDALGRPSEAAEALETFLTLAPDADAGGEVQQLLEQLRR